MPLPGVASVEEPPYVICSKHPNGAVSVGTLPRISAEKGIHHPLAEVSLDLEDLSVPIGIFGRFHNLILKSRKPLNTKGMKIMGQDLASGEAMDITDRIQKHSTFLVVPGEVITETGLSGDTEGDLSEPGMVLKIDMNPKKTRSDKY